MINQRLYCLDTVLAHMNDVSTILSKYLTPVPLSHTTTFLPSLSMLQCFRWHAGKTRSDCQDVHWGHRDSQCQSGCFCEVRSDTKGLVLLRRNRGTPPCSLQGEESQMKKKTYIAELHFKNMSFNGIMQTFFTVKNC